MGIISFLKKIFFFWKKEEIKAVEVEPFIIPTSEPEIKTQEQEVVNERYLKLHEELEAKPENKEIIDAIKTVMDPELGIDIWTLGLVYEIGIEEKKVDIAMTFTSPMCPYGPQLVEQVKEGIKEKGYPDAAVEVVFDPVWQPSDMVKEILGIA